MSVLYFIADIMKWNDQILFLELKKVEELVEDNVVDFDWLSSLLTELVETTFDWISRNREIWMTHDNEEKNDQQSDRLTQVRVFFNKIQFMYSYRIYSRKWYLKFLY